MPHSGGGGSSGGGSHGGGGGSHGGSSGSSRRSSYFPGSHHHVYYYKGKQVSYYSREPIPRKRPLFPVVKFVVSLLVGLFFMMGCLISSVIPAAATFIPTYPKLPERLKYPTAYIDDQAEVTRLSETEKEKIEAVLTEFADGTNIPVCFEIVDYDNWYGRYESLEKYAYQSYVKRWADEDHFLIVVSFNKSGIQEKGLSYVNQWRFETMIGDDLHCLTTRQCQVFNDNFTADLYRLSDNYTLDMALKHALNQLNESLHKKGKVDPQEVFVLLLVVLPALGLFGAVGAALIYMPLHGYKEKLAEFEYYEKNGFPETREEMLARYTRAMHVLKYCPNCGAPNSNNREVCEYCNTNLLKKENER